MWCVAKPLNPNITQCSVNLKVVYWVPICPAYVNGGNLILFVFKNQKSVVVHRRIPVKIFGKPANFMEISQKHSAQIYHVDALVQKFFPRLKIFFPPATLFHTPDARRNRTWLL